MSTHSSIGRQNPDGSITAIYCHWDGHIESVGAMLHTHYQDAAKIDALLALGSLSELGSEIGERHDFRARYTDDDERAQWCLAYGRDRGDTGTLAITVADLIDYYDHRHDLWDAEYQYLFVNGAWFAVGRGGALVPLADVLPATAAVHARPAELAEPVYVAPTAQLDHAVKVDPAAPTAASPIIDTHITAALETFTDEAQRLFEQALAQEPVDKDEVAYWRAQRNAFAKALHYFSSEGVRLNPTGNGYTVPSASRPGALIHRLWRVGGVWHCSCEAGTRGILHWHTALIAGYDRAQDLLELRD